MPYFSFSTQYQDGPHDPIPEEDTELWAAKSRHDTLFKAYQHATAHRCPTLDEWHHQFGSDPKSTKAKNHHNENQVVMRYLLSGDGSVDREGGVPKDSIGKERTHWPVLRVNQFWAWGIENRTSRPAEGPQTFNLRIRTNHYSGFLITATGHPIDGLEKPLFKAVLEDLAGKQEPCDSQSQRLFGTKLTTLLMDHCIGSYSRPTAKSRNGNVSIRQIFLESINKIVREHPVERGRELTNSIILKASEESTLFEDVKSGITNTASLDQVSIDNNIRRAKGLYSEVKDIRDELNILASIVEHQGRVLARSVQPTDNSSEREGSIPSSTDDQSETEQHRNASTRWTAQFAEISGQRAATVLKDITALDMSAERTQSSASELHYWAFF